MWETCMFWAGSGGVGIKGSYKLSTEDKDAILSGNACRLGHQFLNLS